MLRCIAAAGLLLGALGCGPRVVSDGGESSGGDSSTSHSEPSPDGTSSGLSETGPGVIGSNPGDGNTLLLEIDGGQRIVFSNVTSNTCGDPYSLSGCQPEATWVISVDIPSELLIPGDWIADDLMWGNNIMGPLRDEGDCSSVVGGAPSNVGRIRLLDVGSAAISGTVELHPIFSEMDYAGDFLATACE
jgi:hypothetical protein